MEIRPTKLRERYLKIEQPGAMRFSKHAQRAGHQQMSALGLSAAGPLVNQETVGFYGEGEHNRSMLTVIEKPKSHIEGRVGPDLTPVWRPRNPTPDRCRSAA